jgi:hypothetical protein
MACCTLLPQVLDLLRQVVDVQRGQILGRIAAACCCVQV